VIERTSHYFFHTQLSQSERLNKTRYYIAMEPAQTLSPSAWVKRFVDVVPKNSAVLDIACGAGRHSRLFAELGFRVTAVDRDSAAFLNPPQNVTLVHADLEAAPWPFTKQKFGGVVVTNYLHRPLLPEIIAAVADGGVLIYETFAVGNEKFGRPSRADFLLRPDELLDAVRDELEVIAYENIFVNEPKPAMVQRIAAKRICAS
jgi:SAM-dependent methyltransferase